MNIGSALYNYRIKLGLTMEQMSAGIITTSYYSKVEKGSHRISAEDLFKILEEHQISKEHFIKEINQSSAEELFEQYNQKVNYLYMKNDSQGLKRLLAEIEADTKIKEDKRKILQTIIELSFEILDHQLPNEESKQYVYDKLFSLPDWDNFKLTLYCNLIAFYSIEMNQSMIASILAKGMENYTEEQRNKILFILTNMIGGCLGKVPNGLVYYYLAIIEQENPTVANIFSKIMASYYSKIMDYIENSIPELVYKIDAIIELMDDIGFIGYSERMKKYFDKNKLKTKLEKN